MRSSVALTWMPRTRLHFIENLARDHIARSNNNYLFAAKGRSALVRNETDAGEMQGKLLPASAMTATTMKPFGGPPSRGKAVSRLHSWASASARRARRE